MRIPLIRTASPHQTSLLRHYLRYLVANLLGVVAGFISYPIMTRMLDTDQIGILSYFGSISLVLTAILKLGSQNSIQRFYPVYCLGDTNVQKRQTYFASYIQMPALVSLIACVIGAAGLTIVHYVRPITSLFYFYIVIILSEMSVLYSLLENLVRAREQSRFSARLGVLKRYLNLIAFMIVVFYISPDARGVYVARIVCALLALLIIMAWTWRNCDFNIRAFSAPAFRESLSYGLPLVWSEISFIAVAFADRLMLKMPSLGGSFEKVGVYGIGYDLAMYIGDFLAYTLIPAFLPVATRVFETEGREAALSLQRRILQVLYYVAVGLSVGIVVVGQDALVFVAGAENSASIPVFQWIGVNYALYPIMIVMVYGLNLTKKTRRISVIVFISALLNIVINIYLIPRLGVMGAVYATVISYAVMSVLQMVFCPRGYLPTPKAGELLRPLGAGLCMLAIGGLLLGLGGFGGLLGLQNPFWRLCIMGFVFLAAFVVPALAIDHELRRRLFEKLGRLKTLGSRP